MSYWKLLIEGFGKIEKAEIELAPMTLFVGDNNSGKSYLLALAWAVRKLTEDVFMTDSFKETDSGMSSELEKVFLEAVRHAEYTGHAVINLNDILPKLEIQFNQELARKKEELVNLIFNSDCVRLKHIWIKMPDNLSGEICIESTQKEFIVKFLDKVPIHFSHDFSYMKMADFLLIWTAVCLLKQPSVFYMPAARTGFMMSKDVINKYARRKTFNIRMESEKQQDVQPFSRPILEFLDAMNDLSQEQEGGEEYRDIVSFIQQKMAQGNIEISGLPSHELSYIPDGGDKKYPFRAVSAVVTELAPLLLLLSHEKKIEGLFYEEPEMCLHPALQKRMGQVLIRMVNAGIGIATTTHSDIILQHINNMIRLGRLQKNPKDYGYESADLIVPDKVRVYQMSGCKDGTTKVKELLCGDNGFAVPTFNDALDEIMEDVIQIQS